MMNSVFLSGVLNPSTDASRDPTWLIIIIALVIALIVGSFFIPRKKK